jgi:hypothetical protein
VFTSVVKYSLYKKIVTFNTLKSKPNRKENNILLLKAKAVSIHVMERRGRNYSSYSFTTLALDGGEWSASPPGRALDPEKGPPVPIVQEAEWVIGRV